MICHSPQNTIPFVLTNPRLEQPSATPCRIFSVYLQACASCEREEPGCATSAQFLKQRGSAVLPGATTRSGLGSFRSRVGSPSVRFGQANVRCRQAGPLAAFGTATHPSPRWKFPISKSFLLPSNPASYDCLYYATFHVLYPERCSEDLLRNMFVSNNAV